MHRTGLLATFIACTTVLSTGLNPAYAQNGLDGPSASSFCPWDDKSASQSDGYRTFHSSIAATEVSYQIYLPAEYDLESTSRFPVVYWLHGRGGNQRQAEEFADRLRRAAAEGKAPALIVVGVNGRRTSSYTDSKDGNSPVQSVIVKELVAHIDANYRTIASPKGRAVEGFSMGGTGAAKIGTKYPEIFGAFSALAGGMDSARSFQRRGSSFQEIYSGDVDYYDAESPATAIERNADKLRSDCHIRIVIGEKDRNLARNRALHQQLLENQIDHSFTIVPDAGHAPGALYRATEEAMCAFYTRAFSTDNTREVQKDLLTGGALDGERPRLIVSTDIGGSDPDDYQSLVHLLLYADRLDIEGLISSPPHAGRLKHIIEVLDAYDADLPKLLRNSGRDFPTTQSLRSVAVQGANRAAPPSGWSTPTDGSRLIIERAKFADERPLWILAWGSMTDIAQAIHDDTSIKRKLRVYSIGSWNTEQDQAARDYLFSKHADLWWIECDTTFRGMYMGGKQDGDLDNTDFVRRHVRNHGALGDLFWNKKHDIKMGDTPSLFYLLRGDLDDPGSDHWGGSFQPTNHGPNYWSDDPAPSLRQNNRAGAKTVNRWRADFLRDWQRRMDWLQ